MNIVVFCTVDHAKNTFDCSLRAGLRIVLLVVRYPVDLEWIVCTLKKLRSYITFRPTLFLFWDAKSVDYYYYFQLQTLRLIVRSGLDVPTFATRRLHACHHVRAPNGGRWNCGREMSGKFCLNAGLHVTFRDLLYAVKLRHGIDGFTFPPKEGVLRIFSP
jgi:hypothetical protein